MLINSVKGLTDCQTCIGESSMNYWAMDYSEVGDLKELKSVDVS